MATSTRSSAPNDKKKKKAKRTTTKSTPSQTVYIAKIAKKYVGSDTKDKDGKVVKNPNKMTFAKSAISEVEILMNYAIGRLIQNSDNVLQYNGQKTLGKSTLEVATTLAFAGLLRDKALKAGSKAVENYNGFDPSVAPPSLVTAV